MFPSCGGFHGKSQSETTTGQNNNASINTRRTREDTEVLEDVYNLQLFPNPTNGSFTLQCNDENTIEAFYVYNFSGNLVLEEKGLKTQQKTVDVRLDKGTYIVKVIIDGEVIHKKLMVL